MSIFLSIVYIKIVYNMYTSNLTVIVTNSNA